MPLTNSSASYFLGKFACKICIQGFSFAFPVNLTIPVTLSLLLMSCGLRAGDSCFMRDTIPSYLFFECPSGDYIKDFIGGEVSAPKGKKSSVELPMVSNSC